MTLLLQVSLSLSLQVICDVTDISIINDNKRGGGKSEGGAVEVGLELAAGVRRGVDVDVGEALTEAQSLRGREIRGAHERGGCRRVRVRV